MLMVRLDNGVSLPKDILEVFEKVITKCYVLYINQLWMKKWD